MKASELIAMLQDLMAQVGDKAVRVDIGEPADDDTIESSFDIEEVVPEADGIWIVAR